MVSAFETMVTFRRLNTHPKNPKIGSAFYIYKHNSTTTSLDMEQIKKEFEKESLMSTLQSRIDSIVTKSSYEILNNEINLSLDKLNTQFVGDLKWLPELLFRELLHENSKSLDNKEG